MRGGASGRRAPREVGRGGEGEAEIEGWSGESGVSDVTSDAETEEDEERNAPADGNVMEHARKRGERATGR